MLQGSVGKILDQRLEPHFLPQENHELGGESTNPFETYHMLVKLDHFPK